MSSNVFVPDSVTFKYIFSDDYNPVYVNGAIGGMAPSGEIVINFYHERAALPTSQVFSLNKSLGTLGEEILSTPEGHKSSVIRFIQSGVVMDLNRAKIIHKWLGDHIALAEQKQVANEQKPN